MAAIAAVYGGHFDSYFQYGRQKHTKYFECSKYKEN
jgi:hypothetical protein